jgi:hypothetical protein
MPGLPSCLVEVAGSCGRRWARAIGLVSRCFQTAMLLMTADNRQLERECNGNEGRRIPAGCARLYRT